MTQDDRDLEAMTLQQLRGDLARQMGGRGFLNVPLRDLVRVVIGSFVLTFGILALLAGLFPASPSGQSARVPSAVVGLVVISGSMALMWTPLLTGARRFRRFVRTIKAYRRAQRRPA